MDKKNFKEFINSKGFYISLAVCLGVVMLVSGYVTMKNTQEINRQKQLSEQNNLLPSQDIANLDLEPNLDDNSEITETEPVIANEQQPNPEINSAISNNSLIDIPEINENLLEDENNLQTNSTLPEVQDILETQEIEPDVTEIFLNFNENSNLMWPISGQIVMDYSIEHTVYDSTLEQYRVNESISIQAEVGTQVKAAAAGTVVSISTDPQKGNTVVLDHGNGWYTTYSQLQNDVAVCENEIVEAGAVLGGIAEPTKYGVNLGSHLDFKVEKDGVSTDPKAFLE